MYWGALLLAGGLCHVGARHTPAIKLSFIVHAELQVAKIVDTFGAKMNSVLIIARSGALASRALRLSTVRGMSEVARVAIVHLQ